MAIMVIYNFLIDYSDDFFVLNVNFKAPTFKEIKQVRAYNAQTLVGNAGGYIGLFLGYTIREIPTFLRNFYQYLYKNCHFDQN